MRAVVIGGSGFVGSHVADALTDAGHEVTIFDREPSAWLRPEQEMVLGDVVEAGEVLAASAGRDAIYNFAGIANIDESRERPVETVETNMRGNLNALAAARETGAKRYVFASSIYVNSERGSFYRVSKQACELCIEEFQREFGVEYTILRYGTLFGRRADDSNSIHRYLRQALVENRISAVGTGDELREYIHVADAARLSVQVLDSEYANERVVLTGHSPLRFSDLLQLIRETVGPQVEIDLRDPASAGERESAHYEITPYHFRPPIARKLVASYYVDLGQGLVDCLEEIHRAEAVPER
jgi:UDP-glucose 4-epimerase